jgi:hypothetical protein
VTWALDGSGEREFAGGGPTVDLSVPSAGLGADNDDYLFIVAIATVDTEDIGQHVATCNMSLGGVGGGDLQEMIRVRLARDTASEDQMQLFAIRNSDITSQLDVESALTFRCRIIYSDVAFVDVHYACYIVRSDAMPLTGALVDFMQGGVVQYAEGETGLISIINDFVIGDLGLVHRQHGPSASLVGDGSYNVFDAILDTDTRVSAGQTSVIRIGTGMDANQTLGKDNTGTGTTLSVQAVRFAETVTATGPFTPFFDGDGDTGSTVEPELASITSDPEGSSPVIAQVVATEDPPAGAADPAPSIGATTSLLGLAARTATVSTPDQANKAHRGVKLLANVTVVAGGENMVFTIQGKDPVSGMYYTIISTPEITSTGLVVLTVHPGLITAANVAFNNVLPDTWRAVVTHSAGGSHTYQLSASSLE